MSSDLRDALVDYMDARRGGDGLYDTAIRGLSLMRSTSETLPHPMIYRPALCLVTQGAKRLALGNESFDYAEGQALVVSVEMPGIGHVTKASADRPFLGLSLEFDIGLLREVLGQIDARPGMEGNAGPGVFVDTPIGPVADCVARLIRMSENPVALPILYPCIMRELYFWLLNGPGGGRIARVALTDGHAERITNAISVLRKDITRSVRTEELAATARMSPSTFHQHFKSMTSMSPLQYQKRLRLLEARRLLMEEPINVANAAYRVGYESASQFSREYARMFGAPPMRNKAEMKAMAA
jgi:AraC-like DNA-binding protein